MGKLLSARVTLGNAYRSTRARAAGAALVLTYHRVIDIQSDPQALSIDPVLFEEQISALAAGFNVIRASELCDLLAHRRRIPPRSVVVTFDDGYHDLLSVIKPILERHNVPATAFISTALIGTDREQWWDELEALLLREPGASSDPAWNITIPPNTESQRVYLEACERLRAMDPSAREAALGELSEAHGVPRSHRPEYRTLSAEEVVQLAAGGLIDIGSHTVSHQMLSAVDAKNQLQEITEGKRTLEDILGREIGLFSYPYGGADALGTETRDLAERSGSTCAFANWFGLTFPWTDRYTIPRCPTESLDGEAFTARLEQWFAMGR